MKKYLISFVLILSCITLYASTIVWDLYTTNKKIHIHLINTRWVSTIDAEEIIFKDEDGEGKFSNGIAFTYSPQCETYNGMIGCPDEPTYMNVFVNKRKINKLTLVYKNQTLYLVDKRGIYYSKKR